MGFFFFANHTSFVECGMVLYLVGKIGAPRGYDTWEWVVSLGRVHLLGGEFSTPRGEGGHPDWGGGTQTGGGGK